MSDGREVGGLGDLVFVSGYSDMYVMDFMMFGKVGKVLLSMFGFEVVFELCFDFEFYKNCDEFVEDYGVGEFFGLDIYWLGMLGIMMSGLDFWFGMLSGGMGFGVNCRLLLLYNDFGVGLLFSGYVGLFVYLFFILGVYEVFSCSRSFLYSFGNDSGVNLV